MSPRPIAPFVLNLAAACALAVTVMITPAILPNPPASLMPVASAACPDAEVVFARGRQEPPGVGQIGDALVGALRSKTPQSVGVYGVNYPADLDAATGARDIGAHVRSMASSCPNTRHCDRRLFPRRHGGRSVCQSELTSARCQSAHCSGRVVRQRDQATRTGPRLCRQDDRPVRGRRPHLWPRLQMGFAPAALIPRLRAGGSSRELHRRQAVAGRN